MRTTLDVDDDVLASAKEIARRERKTAGRVLSELARQALTGSGRASISARSSRGAPAVMHGFEPFPRRGVIVTNELIRKLRDDADE